LLLKSESAPDAAAAARAARALARGGAIAVVGGDGPGVAEALRDVAAEGPVVLNVGAPDDRLRNERCERRMFHLLPSVTMYVDALAQWAIGRRKLGRWTIEGDGSARGQEIEAAARRAVARQGGALVGADANADLVLLAVDEPAVRSALSRARGPGRPASAAVGGGVAARLALDEAAGFWAVAWHDELDRFSARELNSRFRRRFGGPMTDTSWAAWAALKLVGEAVVRGGASDGAGLVTFLDGAPPFDGHKGAALTFRPWDRQLRQPLYVVGPRKREEVGGRRGPFAVLADTGGANLDGLGTPAAESRCRWSQ
jgi:ABC-type branched-subunit amino acid transport system substrate-binding protein